MNAFIEQTFSDLEEALSGLDFDEEPILPAYERALQLGQETLQTLKDYILTHPFAYPAEEIHFFKSVKPRLVGRLIYYLQVFNIHARRPTGSEKTQRKYLLGELGRVDK